MNISHLPVEKKQYARHSCHENLYVIPYVRGRLVFAEIVARAIEEDGYEQVVVDLPFFMNKGGLWDDAVKLFPQVSSLLIKNDDSTFVTFPFLPNDAGCISLAVVKMLKEWGHKIELTCIDDSGVIHYPRESLKQQEVWLRDDYFVFIDGIEGYYRDVYTQLEETRGKLSEDQRFFSRYRAGLVSERLTGCLKNGKKTLFVCEYRLWWQVRSMLTSSDLRKTAYFSHPWKDLQGALVMEDPLEMWALGGLDDMPKIVELYYKKMLSNTLNKYDKLQDIDGVIKGLLQPAAVKTFRYPSVRKLLSLYRYIQNQTTAECRVTPLLFSHLYHSAHTCIGKKFAREMAKRFLEYPSSTSPLIRYYLAINQHSATRGSSKFNIPKEVDRYFSHTGSPLFSFDHIAGIPGSNRERINLLHQLTSTLSKEEKASLLGTRSFVWETKEDYRLYETAGIKVRDLFCQSNHRKKTQRSWGVVRDGIDWKATLASKAKGEDLLYVRVRKNRSKQNTERVNEFTPVTYIFSDDFTNHQSNYIHDGNAAHENYVLGYTDKTRECDRVETVYFTSSGREEVCYGHITKYELSSITFLYARSIMGTRRYEQIIQRPKRLQCRTPPVSDTEIELFPFPERCIAWAVKYAERLVFVVAKEGWKCSQELLLFASARSVRIVPMPITRFNPDVIDRLRTLHLISNPLKKHPDCDRIMKRFIE